METQVFGAAAGGRGRNYTDSVVVEALIDSFIQCKKYQDKKKPINKKRKNSINDNNSLHHTMWASEDSKML